MEINKRLLGILVIISLTGSGWFINDIFGNDYRGKFMDKKTIALVPIGSIDRELLKKLAGSLGEVFSLPVSIEPPLKQPSYAYSAKRQQYHATTILDEVREKAPPGKGRGLGIVDVDLYVPDLNFVFGQADLTGKAAVISLSRLRQEFYGLPGDNDLFFKRTLKEAVH